MSATDQTANQAQLLVALQDLEDMIAEAENPDQRAVLEEMGFPVEGIDELHAAQKDLEAKIQPAMLNKYRRLRKRTGKAVMPVISSACTGCFTNVPHVFTSSVNKGKVIACETCGRILYWP
ncbi:MAG TPA: C4-type zinc ribbon domain-containing protein [Candidatus Krumholzibacteria bacterium]|nr:C4-type zinc ribbon domain-containing protein [Candidatus Krumholzibacteria bacterium]